MPCDKECSCTPTLTRLAWQLVMACVPVSFHQHHLDTWEARRAVCVQSWTPQHWDNFLASIWSLTKHKGPVSRFSLLYGKSSWFSTPAPIAPLSPHTHISAALRGSPGKRALAASAFSVISLNSWERARCQKCLQVNSSPLSSASDFTPVTLSVFIFCWEGLSVKPVNLFQV